METEILIHGYILLYLFIHFCYQVILPRSPVGIWLKRLQLYIWDCFRRGSLSCMWRGWSCPDVGGASWCRQPLSKRRIISKGPNPWWYVHQAWPCQAMEFIHKVLDIVPVHVGINIGKVNIHIPAILVPKLKTEVLGCSHFFTAHLINHCFKQLIRLATGFQRNLKHLHDISVWL